jgi:hypothetical protein
MRHDKRFRTWAVVGAASLLPFAAACGDDDDPLSEADFLETANAVCDDVSDDMDAAAEDAFGDRSGDPDPEEVAAFFEEDMIPLIQRQIDELDDLEPPAELEDEVDELISTAEEELEQMVDDIEDDPEAFAANDDDPFARTNAMAADLGLTSCDGD